MKNRTVFENCARAWTTSTAYVQFLGTENWQTMILFLCFIDFAKAFDSVDHSLLFHKLLSIGIHGKMYKAIKCTYEKLQAAIRLNGTLTDWFSVEAGVRQGEN